MTRKTIAVAAIAAGVIALTGCGSLESSSLQNAGVNQELKNGQVVGGTGGTNTTRFDTPGHFPAIVRICDGTEGLYVSESSTGIVTVVPEDPGCGYKGTVSLDPSTTTGPRDDDGTGK
jgi:hypothetical protein